MVRKALVQSWLQAITKPQSRKASPFAQTSTTPSTIGAEHEFVVDPELPEIPSAEPIEASAPDPMSAPISATESPTESEIRPAVEHHPPSLPSDEDTASDDSPPDTRSRTLTWQALPELTAIPEDIPEDMIETSAPPQPSSKASPPNKRRPNRSQTRRKFKAKLARTSQATAQGLAKVGGVAKAQTTAISGRMGRTIAQHRWTMVSLLLLLLAAGTGATALWWLSRIPPAPDCRKISAWSADSERLYCAQVAAQTGDPKAILQGIELVKGWNPDHPLYHQGQQSLEQWSTALMGLARNQLNQGDLDGAIKLAQEIPPSSPRYDEVKKTMSLWEADRNRGQRLYEQILAALKKQAWNEASRLLTKLSLISDPHWQNQLLAVRHRIEDEKSAGLSLRQAQAFAQKNPLQTWGQAIALTDPINRQTFVWQSAIAEIQKWRDAVFQLAAEKVLNKDVPAALALVKSVPSNIEFSPEDRNLMRLVYASEVDRSTAMQRPLLEQLGQLMIASQLVQQINTKSRFAPAAKALQPRLILQAEDAFQVTIASSLANIGQLSFLQGAIDQAQKIAPKRPRRIEAQTLIAQWRKDVERIQDNPILIQAQQIAQTGQIPALQQAIGLLSQIAPGRALRSQAQAQIQTWVAQIQTLEDQPILAQARAQAKSGQLSQAIQTASRIAPGRALYNDAQRDIDNWADQIQAIADRATLDRATGLAAEGSLSRAIDLASQINSRSMRAEARQAIAQWKVERDQILRSRAADSNPEPPAPDNRYSGDGRNPSSGDNSPSPAPSDSGTDPSPP